MSVVAAYTYRDGKRSGAIDPAAPVVHKSKDRGSFAWVGLYEPDAEELKAFSDHFCLHHLAIEDALQPNHLPKLEQYGDQLFIIARPASISEGRIVYGKTAYFLDPDFIISVRQGSDAGHSKVRANLEERPQTLKRGVDFVLHGLLDLVVDNYLPVIDTIRDEVDLLEQHAIEATLGPDRIRRLFALRRDLLGFQRTLLPMEEVCAKLANLELPGIDPDVRPYFRDVLDHVRRVSSMASLLREVLGSVVETSSLIAQQHQSDITRTLAAWAAILAVPTAIAGIYGMNFVHMPELESQYGYFVVLGVIGVACAGLFLHFRRLDWL
jgi:magnesium transporter